MPFTAAVRTVGLLAALAIGGSAHAEPSTAKAVVFVSPFQAVNREASALATLLPSFLAQQLGRMGEMQVVELDQVGPVADVPADAYLQSCPAGEAVGCAFVVAEIARADFALAGTVESLQVGTRVQVHIIDVTTAREVVSFRADLGVGDDTIFVEGVARVLGAVVRGEVGAESDIREQEDPAVDAAEEARKEDLRKELEALNREIGEVTTLSLRSGEAVSAPKLTEADLAEQMDREGVKPWERIGMAPGEYLRYKNSGVDLPSWRRRMEGRQSQLLLRPFLGVERGPSSTQYHGRYLLSSTTLQVVETWAWQAVQSGTGFQVGGNVEPAVGTPKSAKSARLGGSGLTLGRRHPNWAPRASGPRNGRGRAA